jgi:hypothetical protein
MTVEAAASILTGALIDSESQFNNSQVALDEFQNE